MAHRYLRRHDVEPSHDHERDHRRVDDRGAARIRHDRCRHLRGVGACSTPALPASASWARSARSAWSTRAQPTDAPTSMIAKFPTASPEVASDDAPDADLRARAPLLRRARAEVVAADAGGLPRHLRHRRGARRRAVHAVDGGPVVAHPRRSAGRARRSSRPNTPSSRSPGTTLRSGAGPGSRTPTSCRSSTVR